MTLQSKNVYTYFKIFTKLSLCYLAISYCCKKPTMQEIFLKIAKCANTKTALSNDGIELNKLEERTGVIQYNANDPIEDRYSAYELTNFPGYFLAVLDGHGGWDVSDYANKRLYIEFDNTYKELSQKNSSMSQDDLVINSLLKTFEKIENEYLNIARNKKISRGGSCVLVSVVSSTKIYTAQLGDSEAKLFRKKDKKYEVVELSNTHNSERPEEKEKLFKKFPNDKDIVVCKRADGTVCYVKGRLQPTRSMGDFYLKYQEFNGNKIKNFNGPYIEAVPEIKVIDITCDDQYIVMASDGMWDFLDAEDVIDVLKTKTIKSPHDLSNSLFNRVMAKASEEANMSVNQLFNLRPGVRRSYYDDTTIVVFDLKH